MRCSLKQDERTLRFIVQTHFSILLKRGRITELLTPCVSVQSSLSRLLFMRPLDCGSPRLFLTRCLFLLINAPLRNMASATSPCVHTWLFAGGEIARSEMAFYSSCQNVFQKGRVNFNC